MEEIKYHASERYPKISLKELNVVAEELLK